MALGDRLFHDPRLSYENTHSCNSCHDTSTNGATAPGSTLGAGLLNIPTVFNAALNFRLNWEGDVRTLEDQVEQIMGKPQMMGSNEEEALRRLRADADVARQFREAFAASRMARDLPMPSLPTSGPSSHPEADLISGLKATSTPSPPRSSPGIRCSSRLVASLAIKA